MGQNETETLLYIGNSVRDAKLWHFPQFWKELKLIIKSKKLTLFPYTLWNTFFFPVLFVVLAIWINRLLIRN